MVGVTESQREPPLCRRLSRSRHRGHLSQTSGTLAYHALLVKPLQRRFANGFSFPSAAYTYGKVIDLTSDNDGGVSLTNVYAGYNRGPADYDVTHTFSASWTYTLPFPRERAIRRMADQRPAAGSFRLPVYGVSEPESAVHADRGHPGPAYRPNRIGSGQVDNPTVD